MSKKTLPDELRSVLLAHSLDAPDPDSTVDRILAADRGRTGRADRVGPDRIASRRWWTSSQLLGAAVVIALLVLGVRRLLAARRGSPTATRPARGRTPRSSGGQAGRPANRIPASPPAVSQQRPNAGQRSQCRSGRSAGADRPAAAPASRAGSGRSARRPTSPLLHRRDAVRLRVPLHRRQRPAQRQRGAGVRPAGRQPALPVHAGAGEQGRPPRLPGRACRTGSGCRAPTSRPADRPGRRDQRQLHHQRRRQDLQLSIGKLVAKACQQADLTARVVTADGGVTGQHQVLQLTNLTVEPVRAGGLPEPGRRWSTAGRSDRC